MALLLETTLGDVVVDLDLEGSPTLCRNLIKLAKARYYTNTLIYSVQPGCFCQLGDPKGDGTGGCSIYGLIDAVCSTGSSLRDETRSTKRFLKSDGRQLTKSELREKGRVVAIEMGGVSDTIGSQFIITTDSGEGRALDGLNSLDNEVSISTNGFFSLGVITEDVNDVIGKINAIYCDKDGRPYADVRINRAHILDDPYDDPSGMKQMMESRKITLLQPSELPEKDAACARWLASASPEYKRPPEEIVEIRISAVEQLAEEDEKKRQKFSQEKEDKSRAVVLEMLGDLPSADMKPPENVLFVCKLNSVTDDEDLQLIFSRFDPEAKAEIIRDQITGDSLQYAFVEFATKQQCTEAYFKMNNTLIDDRRIKVDFSQSVAKVWNKYAKRRRMNGTNGTGRAEHISQDQHNDRKGLVHERAITGRGNIGDRLSREVESTRTFGGHNRRSRSPSRSPSNSSSSYSRRNSRRDSKKRRRKHRDDKHRRAKKYKHRRDDEVKRKHHKTKKRRDDRRR